ncbi:hypothetical protein [Gandjariella thermophila]|uniref:Mercury transporter n=1 Tax=Gandjariella thermophila TaxID=1931992 RepID=A0A4D4JDP1_9PSEU|nr:hypothetical protein [Gandjariella thermophila]GDY33532.1 hypothetical protein GTS_51650 [Gandjariella thermophila]
MTGDTDRSGWGGGLAMVSLGLLMVLCCAGPALIAGGALGVLGGAVRNPWLIGAGALLVLGAVGYPLYRRARRRSGQAAEDCCPPPPTTRHQHGAARPDRTSRS